MSWPPQYFLFDLGIMASAMLAALPVMTVLLLLLGVLRRQLLYSRYLHFG